MLAHSALANLWSNMTACRLTHIVETSDWAIKAVGTSVVGSLNVQDLVRSRISYTPIGLRNQIIHFDSVHTFFTKTDWHFTHPSNRAILTWFHVIDGDPRLERLVSVQEEVAVIHTSCESTKRTLVTAGIDEKKIVVIPLGVDTRLFTPATPDQKREARQRLGIAPDRLVIGSFQKDGVGWGEGLEPKLIKGPDILVQTITRLKQFNPFILLTGPARGYVKRRLDELDIDYIHTYLQETNELPAMYHALDLYLIPSRLEGGPKSLLEAWASGVPVVSTRVGMVSDIAEHEQTALLVDVEDVNMLAKQSLRLINDNALQTRLTNQALQIVERYSWNNIARQYFDELYRPLL